MKRQPHWDQFEVALLVDAYIRITEKGENKKIVLEKLSKQLRDKACNEGLEIDDTFRNLNGMMWQIGFVECAFKKRFTENVCLQNYFNMLLICIKRIERNTIGF